MRVLVTGGTGYLGQFVVRKLATDHEVTYTQRAAPSSSSSSPDAAARAVQCDLTDAAAVRRVFATHGPFDAVVNTAALSQPGVCEQNPERARAINVPAPLLAALAAQRDSAHIAALLIHLSTDQVYSGADALSTEAAAVAPVNTYGATKVAAEAAIAAAWPAHVALRSSIIYGPQAPVPVDRPLFVQFIEETLRTQTRRTFFHDEIRSPVLVHDITRIIAWLLTGENDRQPGGAQRSEAPWPWPLAAGTYNMGGPDRLSRADMVAAVAAHRGLPQGCVERAASASVQRAAASPLDISMDSSRLQAALPFALTPFARGLDAVFA